MRLVLALLVLLLALPSSAATPSRQQLARELHALTAPDEALLRAALDQALGLVRQDLLRRNPGREAEVAVVLGETTAVAMQRELDRLGETAASYSAEALGADDLQAIVAFYRSPAGQRLIAAMPAVSERTQALVAIWMREVLRDAIPRIVERAHARGLAVGP